MKITDNDHPIFIPLNQLFGEIYENNCEITFQKYPYERKLDLTNPGVK